MSFYSEGKHRDKTIVNGLGTCKNLPVQPQSSVEDQLQEFIGVVWQLHLRASAFNRLSVSAKNSKKRILDAMVAQLIVFKVAALMDES